MSERIHHVTICEGKTPEDLAVEIGRMRYDALKAFLGGLARNFEAEAAADEKRGRVKLADALRKAAARTRATQAEVELAWLISRPFMTDELALHPEIAPTE